MREVTLGRVRHPDFMPTGAAVLVDTQAMDQLVDRLQNGWPEGGWEGDPRLCVAFDRPSQRWELWRLEHDGQHRLVMRSKPGFSFPPNLIETLRSFDTRYNNVQDSMDAHNAAVEKAAQAAIDEQMSEAAGRLAHALKKDLGYLYG